jgi:hypothetical protein
VYGEKSGLRQLQRRVRIYLRVSEADLAVLVLTTDGDLAVDARRLHDLPLVAEAMMAAETARLFEVHPSTVSRLKARARPLTGL